MTEPELSFTNYESPYMRDRGHSCKKSDQGMGKEFVATSEITAGLFVKFSGTDDIHVEPCGLNGNLIGVAMNDAAANEVVDVQMDGFHWIQVGTAANLIPGDWVVSDANGQAQEMTCPGSPYFTVMGGFILSTPSEDDDCVCLKVQPKVFCEPQR